MPSRRFLPSISLLSAFDAVLRSGSITAAARELDLTQSTVSRLVLTLEEQLGRPLFLRERKRLIPTQAALAYGEEVRSALERIERASMTFVANPDGGALSLALLPTLGARWLGPRMGAFLAENPGVTLNLSTRFQPVRFADDSVDAALCFYPESGPPEGVSAQRLFGERLTACASPEFLDTTDPQLPADLAALPLLQLETRRGAWETWFRAQGGSAPQISGMLFDQFSMMVQAAVAGLGVALLPAYLARAEVSGGRLRPLFTQAIPGSGAYWLTWPPARDAFPPLLAFRRWLAAQPLPEGHD